MRPFPSGTGAPTVNAGSGAGASAGAAWAGARRASGGLPAHGGKDERARRDQCQDGRRSQTDGQPMNLGRLRLRVFMTSNLVAATIPSVLCFERGSSNASGAGVTPASRRIHAA